MLEHEQSIHNWIRDFVSKSNPQLNGHSPCPYAAQALKEKRVDILLGSTPERDGLLLTSKDFEHLDVKVFCYNASMFDAVDFSERIYLINQAVADKDVLVLDDHPNTLEVVNGVKMNHGTYALMFAQSLSRLDKAAEMLARRGYYKNWPEEYLKDLFQGRKDPR